jgi:hypothetical protein
MKKRNLVIGLLVTLAVALTGATFAFWAGTIGNADTTNTGTITIGEADNVTTTVATSDYTVSGSALVPVGYEDAGDNEVSNVDLVFDVLWDGTGAAGATGTLNVTVDSVVITGESTSYAGLFTVDVSAATGLSIVNGTLLEDVTINVEFTTEPANQAAYDEIAAGTLTVTLSFDVTAD